MINIIVLFSFLFDEKIKCKNCVDLMVSGNLLQQFISQHIGTSREKMLVADNAGNLAIGPVCFHQPEKQKSFLE